MSALELTELRMIAAQVESWALGGRETQLVKDALRDARVDFEVSRRNRHDAARAVLDSLYYTAKKAHQAGQVSREDLWELEDELDDAQKRIRAHKDGKTMNPMTPAQKSIRWMKSRSASRSNPERNAEGMTWEEWAYAAGVDPKTPSRELRRAWKAGEDPTDHRAAIQRRDDDPRTNPSWRAFVREQAAWDEGHAQPAVEYGKVMSVEDALTKIEEDLRDPRAQRQFWDQHRDELEDDVTLAEAYEFYVGEYLDRSERRLDHKPNPSDDRELAVAKYEEFHRYQPTKIGEFNKDEFGRDFIIPKTMLLVGSAKYTTYRSSKVDPSTLQLPKKPVNYIHEHDAGVEVYLPVEMDEDFALGMKIRVPDEFRNVESLVCLGKSLGYAFTYDGDIVEADAIDPLPELYCVPSGKCLLVIQDKRDVLAMIWGGGLGVFARGIDG